MRAFVATILALVSFDMAAQPSIETMVAEVSDNVASEYAECSAFFAITQGALLSSGKDADAAKFKDASNQAAQFSLLAAKDSRSHEMATKVTLARIQMSMKDMQKTIENNYSNMSLLMTKHLEPCIEAMNGFAPLFQRWTEKIQQKYDKPADKRK